MLGTILNAAGILLGGGIGLARRQPLTPATEGFFKVTLGAFIVFYGLRLTWMSLSGPWLHILKQLLIAVIAMSLGKLVGRLLGLQDHSNELGRRARERIERAVKGNANRWTEGFKTCAALFCATPLGILGSIQDGLSAYYYPLATKAVIEGLATMGFVRLFGPGVLLAVLPVFVLQGSITLLCAQGAQALGTTAFAKEVWDSVNAVGGLLVFCVALVALQLKKLEVTNYLLSLVIAPLLTWAAYSAPTR